MDSLILNGRFASGCCGKPTIIVRSRQGGFVTQNCSRCGKSNSVSLSELPSLKCTKCRRALVSITRKNYFYQCLKCDLEWELPLLVPHWSELFDECGFYVESDGTTNYNSYVDAASILSRLQSG
jgi:DNA-directed RNA polymerase subunit RPC12/RpoP